ncbi:hypothetical protein [Homoserinibacter sp. GY 40078]|uniref:hypothetical protein n=1 Tax=Homoserinibacter sp. GY 40078 TaxID=2603275 RepID=UPI0011CB029F|nr:hypothetical protein [Homoserinibacter sp. GY 40078]TXK19504.1 hypothetical protein FVQ89_06350 [Homoserinibacter sp. GY 40078]
MAMKKLIAAAALAVALVAAPAASAMAAPAYVPVGPIDGPTTIVPGGSATFNFGSFSPNETVVFTLTGEGVGPGSLATAGARSVVGSVSVQKEAAEDGSVAVEVTLPEDASGEYTLHGTGQTSGVEAESVIAVDGGTAGDGGGTASPGDGADSDLGWVIWVAVALVIVVVVPPLVVRRRRTMAEATVGPRRDTDAS